MNLNTRRALESQRRTAAAAVADAQADIERAEAMKRRAEGELHRAREVYEGVSELLRPPQA